MRKSRLTQAGLKTLKGVMYMSAVLAFNVGGTHMRAAIVYGGVVICKQQRPTNKHNYPASLARLLEMAEELLKETSHSVNMAGIAVAAHRVDGVIKGSGNLPGWEGENLTRDISVALGLPAIDLGDCEAESLGEAQAHGCSVVYVGMGTGVGVGICIRDMGHRLFGTRLFERMKRLPLIGQLLKAFGLRYVTRATELGHFRIDPTDTYKCGCGGFGHFEACVGGNNLAVRFGVPTVEDLSGMHWTIIIQYVADFLMSLATIFPDMPIVLGGTVGKLITDRPERMRLLTERMAQLTTPVGVPVVLTMQSDEPALIGAAVAARQFISA